MPQSARHEWGTRALVLRLGVGEAGSLREWKERKARTNAKAKQMQKQKQKQMQSKCKSGFLRFATE
jgi:hypothetical protein